MAFEISFEREGPFESWYACQRWLTERGYSFGSTCVMSPVGVLKGDYTIAKWRNLTPKERAELDGSVSGDFRNGPVTLTLKVAPTLEENRDYVAIPEHLDALAESTLRMAESGDDPSDMLRMLHHGLNKSRPKDNAPDDH